MKKNYFLLLFLLCTGTFCTAQNALPEFAPHGAEWVYESIDNGPTPHEHDLSKMTVANNDTVISGHLCRIFILDNYQTFYAYRDSLQIWGHSYNTTQPWQLCYDFNWHIGDTVIVPTIVPASFDSNKYTVYRKGDTIINSTALPFLVLHTLQLGFSVTVVLNIGPLNDFFTPNIFSRMIPEYGGTTIRCYTDNVIGSIKAPGVVVCDTNFHVSVPIEHNYTDVDLYPNPTPGIVHIQSPAGNPVLQADITTIDGRVMKTIFLPGAAVIMPDGLQDGMYLFLLHLRDESVVTKKVMLQHTW